MSRNLSLCIVVSIGLLGTALQTGTNSANAWGFPGQWPGPFDPILDQEYVPTSPMAEWNTCPAGTSTGQVFSVGFSGKLERLELAIFQMWDDFWADPDAPAIEVEIYRTFWGHPAPWPVASVTVRRGDIPFYNYAPGVPQWTPVDLFWSNVQVQQGETLAVMVRSLTGRCYRWDGNVASQQTYPNGTALWKYQGNVVFEHFDLGFRTFVRP